MRSQPHLRSSSYLLYFVMIAAVSAVPALAQTSLGDVGQVDTLQRTLADVADSVRPSVVAIRTERHLDPEEEGEIPNDEAHKGLKDRVYPAVGSGVVISADGLILTNEHVIQNAEPEGIVCILSNGEQYSVQGVTSDPRADMAVLRIDAKGLQPIKLGDVSNVRQGHFAIVMGNPFGSAWENHGRPAMSFGVVSALGQELTHQLDPFGERYYGNLIQTDARINPGNSGGPLLNIRGELIGINTAISTRSGGSEGVGYAISIDKRTKAIIVHLSKGEEVEYGYLGVDLDAPSPTERSAAGAPRIGGAIVREVRKGTPAAAAKLKEGDIIVGFDGEDVLDRDHLVRMVGAARVDNAVSLLVYRDKHQLAINVMPGRRPMDIHPINTYAAFSWRGMRVADLSPAVRKEHKLSEKVAGVLVTEVEPESSADKAGVQPGQVLRQVGEVPINGLRRLRGIVQRLSGPIKIIVAADKDRELTLPD